MNNEKRIDEKSVSELLKELGLKHRLWAFAQIKEDTETVRNFSNQIWELEQEIAKRCVLNPDDYLVYNISSKKS